MAYLHPSQCGKHKNTIHHLLVGGLSTPLKNKSSSVGMMTFSIYGKIKNVPNHQPENNLAEYNSETWAFHLLFMRHKKARVFVRLQLQSRHPNEVIHGVNPSDPKTTIAVIPKPMARLRPNFNLNNF